MDYVSLPTGVSLQTSYYEDRSSSGIHPELSNHSLESIQTDDDEMILLEEDTESGLPWALGAEESEVLKRKRTAGVSIYPLSL